MLVALGVNAADSDHNRLSALMTAVGPYLDPGLAGWNHHLVNRFTRNDLEDELPAWRLQSTIKSWALTLRDLIHSTDRDVGLPVAVHQALDHDAGWYRPE